MFKKVYKICVSASNTDEAFKTLCTIFGKYGEIIDVTEESIVDSKTLKPVYDIIVFKLKASPIKFKVMLKAFAKTSHALNKIKGY